jgi:UDP:flavonoid glycosyltransferase YjiC (YdhE family)
VKPARGRRSPPRIDFAWELGARTGHVTTLHPVALAMKARGYAVRFLLREVAAGADLEGAGSIPREPAPVWVGPMPYASPLNFGEILHNFGYAQEASLRPLVDAWRERLADSAAVIANVAPAGHLAARTLGVPSFEVSQGFHIPPPAMPAPPLRDWEPAPRARLEAADRRVLGAMNAVLAAYGVAPLATIGDLFAGRELLLTYPELDIYPERGPSEYYGITDSAEGDALPEWPQASGPRVFAYLYRDYPQREGLLEALRALGLPALVFCRGLDAAARTRNESATMTVSDRPVAVSRALPQCDLVVCHGSHQMTAQALLAGKPLLMLPTQLEQFLITRRVVRMGAGLGVMQEVPDADFGAALAEVARSEGYAAAARTFAQRYARHDRSAALSTILARCEAAIAACRR